MKRVLPLLSLLVCLRANVVTYENENAIEKLRYEESPYILSLNADWHRNEVEGHVVLTQDYEFPKEWSDYCVYVRFKAPSGYGLWIGDKFIGASHDRTAYRIILFSPDMRRGRRRVCTRWRQMCITIGRKANVIWRWRYGIHRVIRWTKWGNGPSSGKGVKLHRRSPLPLPKCSLGMPRCLGCIQL